MNDFLIYAARLQDAGVNGVWVSFGTAKDRTRTMTVSVMGNDSGRPPRKFDLDGTDRILGRIKDDLLYEEKMTPENIQAACIDFPALKEDLCEWFADYLRNPPLTDEEIAATEVDGAEIAASTERMMAYMKGLTRGMDSLKERGAITKPGA